MDIILYLIKLVENQKEIGIQGLGTFYKKKSPGRYDINTHSFLPPTFKLQFKTDLTERTGLAEYISKKRNISIESANFFINQFVDGIREQLRTEHTAEFGTIGRLVELDDMITFEPQDDVISDHKFFGLPQIKEDEILSPSTFVTGTQDLDVPVLKIHNDKNIFIEHAEENLTEQEKVGQKQHERVNDRNNEQLTKEPVEDTRILKQTNENLFVKPLNDTTDSIDDRRNLKDLTNSELESVIADNLTLEENPGDLLSNFNLHHENFSKPEKQSRNVTSVYLSVILTLIVILIGFFMFYFVYPNTIDNHDDSSDEISKKAIVTPQRQNVVKKDTDSIIKPDTIIKNEFIQPIDTIDTTYEVIGSSPYSLKEADQFIANMKAKHGLTAKIVSQKKGKKIKISIATFKTKKQAELERPDLIKKLGIKGLYTYPNTHKIE